MDRPKRHPDDEALIEAINKRELTEDELEGFMDNLAEIRELPEASDDDAET